VKPGQTLYQISVNKVGKYNGKVLSQLQDLNPWLSDPDRIHPGQKIRVPTAATNSTETQRAAQQASNAAPAEAGKQ
jgi:LysM repeat protein